LELSLGALSNIKEIVAVELPETEERTGARSVSSRAAGTCPKKAYAHLRSVLVVGILSVLRDCVDVFVAEIYLYIHARSYRVYQSMVIDWK